MMSDGMFFLLKLLISILIPTVTLFGSIKHLGAIGAIQVLLAQILFCLMMSIKY